ncbi:S8 family peptidase [Leptospira sp. WS92.C1]
MTKIKIICLAVFMFGFLYCSNGENQNEQKSFVSNLLSTLQIEQPAFLTSRLSISSIENPKVRGLDLPDRIPGKYIVVFDEALPNSESYAKSTSIAAEWKEAYQIEVQHVFQSVLNGMSIQATDEQIALLAKDERVQYIEADQTVFLHGENQTLITVQPRSWGLDIVDQRNLGLFDLDNLYHYRTNASLVHAYIVDSGIKATLPQFGGRVSGGVSFIDDGRGTDDCSGHGTGVASIVGANPISGETSTLGMTRPNLHPVRIFPCDPDAGSPSSRTIQAFEWIADNHIDPAVVNLSFGKMGSSTPAKKAALANLISLGITVVVSSGNDGTNGYGNNPYCSDYFPVNVPGVITVSSTDIAMNRVPLANVGDCIHIFAPGDQLQVLDHTGAIVTQGGTSFAAPHVTGVAAMFLAGNSQATPAQVKKRIQETATLYAVNGVSNTHNSDKFLYSPLDAPVNLASNGTYMPLEIQTINEHCRGLNTVEWKRPLVGGTTFNYEVYTSPYKDFHADVALHGTYGSSSPNVSVAVSVTMGQQKYIRVRARQQLMPFPTWSHYLTSDTPATYFNGCL